MPQIRIMAAAAATGVVLAFTLSPTSARSCDDGNESCAEVARRTSPMKLDQFMKTWKPVSVSKRVKKQKAARRPAAKQVAEPAVAETAPPSQAEGTVAATPEKTIETDGVAITSFNDLNELDAAADQLQAADPAQTANQVQAADQLQTADQVQTADQAQAADQVQVVAFNEVNEIDLAAPPPPAPSSETTGQSIVSPEPTPADNSWIGKLLLAFAGTIAVAGTARMLIA